MEAIYDKIGIEYDTTRKADPAILSRLASLLDIDKSRKYVDVACGTGNYTFELARFGGIWSAFDNSRKMLSEARAKSSLVNWEQFDVTETAFENNYFDGATCSLAVHHFPDMEKAFGEIARILKPEGKFIVFTSTSDQMRIYWLNHYFPVMMERSCDHMPSLEVIEQNLDRAGICIEVTEPFFVTPDLQDFFLYSGKQRPEMYLSNSFRKGISSFHNYCSESELDSGLNRLREDIETGAIKAIMKKYESKNGDYLFISSRAH
jgi:ubiquinone/menaquinone biosynthesis C-methylase UbiE